MIQHKKNQMSWKQNRKEKLKNCFRLKDTEEAWKQKAEHNSGRDAVPEKNCYKKISFGQLTKMDKSIIINVVLNLISVLWLYKRIFLLLENKPWRGKSIWCIQSTELFRKKIMCGVRGEKERERIKMIKQM